MPSQPNVFLRFYNATNLGDDLFVKVIAERYQNRFLISRQNPLTPKPERNPFKSLDNVRIKESAFEFFATRIFDRIFGKKTIIPLRARSKTKLMVYIGGSIFMEGSSIQRWKKELASYKQLDMPYYILGSNFGPYVSSSFKQIVYEIAERSADVCFRDRESFDAFSNLPNIRHASDIVLTLDTTGIAARSNPKHVVISVINSADRFSPEISDYYEKTIVKLVKYFHSAGFSSTLMSFCRHEGDEEAIERIIPLITKDQINVDKYFYRGNIDEALNILGSSSIVVASRFHAMILGLLLEKRVLPLAYSNKTNNFLNDIQFEGMILDIRDLKSFDVESINLEDLKSQDMSPFIQLAESQFSVLDTVLDRAE